MMTLEQLKILIPDFAVGGEGKRIAQVCRTSKRITMFDNDSEAGYHRYKPCGDGCQFRDDPHLDYRLTDESQAAPKQRISSSWRRMVDAA